LYHRVLWWMVVGAIAGMILGISGVLAGSLAESKDPLDLDLRLTLVVAQSIAGFIAGVILGRKIHEAHLPTLKDLLSSLSALTVGLFATIVTLRFIVEGLEPARTLSSRLSVSTTILITLLAIPGAIGYLLANRRFKAANHLSDINRRPDRQS
jgi:NAD/NADP transhydrogenase beta subunit